MKGARRSGEVAIVSPRPKRLLGGTVAEMRAFVARLLHAAGAEVDEIEDVLRLKKTQIYLHLDRPGDGAFEKFFDAIARARESPEADDMAA